MSRVIVGQVYKALVDSIELRWKPIAKGVSVYDVPSCQLCELFDVKNAESPNCIKCPLFMIGQHCNSNNSAWMSYINDKSPANAKNMIGQLQKCLDTFFPAGISKG